MDKIKAFLEKYPRINKIVRRIYIPMAMKYIFFKQYGRRNRLGDLWAQRGNGWAEGKWNSRHHPHRSFIAERIAGFSPIHSILEIGCAAGPNLYMLAKRFPHSEIRGIEINPHAVEVGNEGFSQEGISNVKLTVGRAEDLSEFKDKSFDVVFTKGVLLYISRGAIRGVIKEMLRIARKGLILIEEGDFNHRLNDTNGIGVYRISTPFPIWVRDYAALLKQFVREAQVTVTKIPKEWDLWPDSGVIVEVILD